MHPILLVSSGIALLLGLTFHEFAHAWTATRLGDPTPRWAGRVTLNPIAHLDPVGAVMFVLLILGYAPIAWGKPVPINPASMRWGRRGAALATVAGPLSNLLLAVLVAGMVKIAWVLAPQGMARALAGSSGLTGLLFGLIFINVALATFNLLPIPPLDGFGILEGLAPPAWERHLHLLRQYGMGLLLLLVMIGFAARTFSPLDLILRPMRDALLDPLLDLANLRIFVFIHFAS